VAKFYGMKNLGTNCFLNVVIQITFHVKELREQIFMAENAKVLTTSLKNLFKQMEKKVAVVNPSEIVKIFN
jgi:uncharacterized UBP type Zn finger protein